MIPAICARVRVLPRQGDAAIGQRFGDVQACDGRRCVEIGERARNAQHAMIAACRELEPVGGLGEEVPAGGLGCRQFLQQFAVELGVAMRAALLGHVLDAVRLDAARGGDADRDVGRGFGGRRQREIGGAYRRHVDMQVDAVEQRAGDLRLVFDGAFGRAAAGLAGIVEIAAAA